MTRCRGLNTRPRLVSFRRVLRVRCGVGAVPRCAVVSCVQIPSAPNEWSVPARRNPKLFAPQKEARWVLS